MAVVETLIVGGLDLSTICHITSAEGILAEPPIGGDLVELDFTPGGQWVKGEPEPMTFDVPLIMRSQVQDVAMGQLRQVQALQDGTARTVTRRLVVNGATVEESCTGVVSAAVQVAWDFAQKKRVGCVLLIQNISGSWL